MSNGRPLKVDLLARPEATGSVLYGLYDVLSLVGSYEKIIFGKGGSPLAEVRIVADTSQQFVCRGGTPVAPDLSYADATGADLIVTANLSFPLDQSPVGQFPRAAQWLREQYDSGATIASVCSGAILLAEAGLLNGCEITTHWAYAPLFQRCYPSVEMRPERILSVTGTDDRIVLAGGVGSWQDLALYLIARFIGPHQAVQSAKFLVMPHHTDGQLPYAAVTRQIQKEDKVIADCQYWISENYASANPVQQLIERSGLPQRTFNRRFKAATGYRPIEYVHAIRIEEAKNMLETTSDTLDDIAYEVGYEDPRSFRRLFANRVGLPVSTYRKKFHVSRFSA